MRNILLLSLTIFISMLGSACGSSSNANIAGGNAENFATTDTPTEAYKRLFAAVKAKDTEGVKNQVSKNTQDFAISLGERQKSPVEKVFENGFTETTFAASLPEIRDERVARNMGAVEVWNSKRNVWEDLPFILEGGTWKLAIGEVFGGKYNSPGKGLSVKEKESANTMPSSAPVPGGVANGNAKPASNTKFDGPQVEPLANSK